MDELTQHGRIDVHNHMLPGVDDGCADLAESLVVARSMLERGYTHCVCTPHIAGLSPWNDPENITAGVAKLSEALAAHGVGLTLYPGAEHNVHELYPRLGGLGREQIMTLGGRGQHVLMDMWADELGQEFEHTIERLQGWGFTVILAHPERMGAMHLRPATIERVLKMDVLLQGNLQCLSDPPDRPTRQLAERWLAEGRYHLLGSDLHRPGTLASRWAGLARAMELAGAEALDRLMRVHPGEILWGGAAPA